MGHPSSFSIFDDFWKLVSRILLDTAVTARLLLLLLLLLILLRQVSKVLLLPTWCPALRRVLEAMQHSRASPEVCS